MMIFSSKQLGYAILNTYKQVYHQNFSQIFEWQIRNIKKDTENSVFFYIIEFLKMQNI